MEHNHRVRSADGLQLLAKVRAICVALPEVKETIDGFGCTMFRVNGKSFIRMSESDDGVLLSFKSNHENQEILLQRSQFVKAPYIGQHGWVSIREIGSVYWSEIGELFTEAYLRTAPKGLLKRALK